MFLRIKLRVLAFILLAFAWSAPAQSLSQYQVTPLQTAATATGNGTTMTTAALGAVSVQITGTFSATVTFEGTMDGSTWVALMATNANDDVRATTATAAGVYSVVLNGCTSFRARISSYSSGTVTVKARLGNGVISRTSSGGGGSGADPTGSVGLSAVNGVATTFMRSDAAPALNQGITPTWTGAHLWSGVTGTFRRNSIGTTSTDGLILENATVAAAGAQQYSPVFSLIGQGWKTNATAASQTVNYTFQVRPVQGSANPTGNLVITPNVNGSPTANGTFTLNSDGGINAVRIGTDGNVVPTGGIGVTSVVFGGSYISLLDTALARFSTNVLRLTNASTGAGGLLIGSSTDTGAANTLTVARSGIGVTSSDGIALVNNTAAASGAQQWSPRIRWVAQGWKTASTAASQTVEFISELQPLEGTTNPAGLLNFKAQVNGGGFSDVLSIGSGGIIGKYGGGSAVNIPGFGSFNSSSQLRTGFAISSDTGTFYSNSSAIFNWSNGFGGPGGLYVESARVFGFSNSVFLRGAAAANLAYGAADSGTPVEQTQSVQNGSGTNIAGANWTRDASRGTGNAAGGAHVWRVAPAGSSGSSQNALVERMRLDENGLKFTEVSSTTTPSSNTISVYAKDKSGTSALYLKNDAGTETEIGAASSPYTAPPAVADWTWVNQGSATGTDTTSGIDLYAPNGSGDNLRILARAVPSTPYTITAAISITMFADNYAAAGFCWRESGTGEVAYVGLTHATTYTLGFNKYASLTSYDSTYFNNSFAPGDVLWIKASDDGTNRTVSISRTGTSWLQIATHTRTDFLTPDQVGFFANSNQSTVTTGVLATLRSWSVQ